MLKNDKPAKIQANKLSACNNSLRGKCLVNIETEADATYKNAVIYITSVSSSKVEGVIINKLLFGTAVVECQVPTHEKEIKKIYEDLYQGGPKNTSQGCVLFPKDECIENDPFAEVHGEIAISTSFGILQEILDGTGPDKKIIAMGHCEWHRGELEWEIFNNKWLIIPSNSKLLFDTNFANRWEEAQKISEINLKGYIPQIGLA